MGFMNILPIDEDVLVKVVEVLIDAVVVEVTLCVGVVEVLMSAKVVGVTVCVEVVIEANP